MKLVLFLYFAVAIVGLTHSSEIGPDEVYAYLDSYAQQLSSTLRMARGGPLNVQCYDKYIPQISAVAEDGKNATTACTSLADSRKSDELNKVKEQRETLDSMILGIQNYLSGCTAKTDVIEYLSCLKDNAMINQAAIGTIAATSTDLSDKLGVAFETIDSSENNCIGNVITKSKQDTDELFAALQRCLINGFVDPEPQPEPSPEPEEPQPEEPQPEEPQPEEPQPEEPQPEEPQPEEPQPEEPQPEEPQPEEPQPEEPEAEEPQPEEPDAEEPQPEEPEAEEPQPEEPNSDDYPEADI